MEREFLNLAVWVWRYRENLRNYPGLHLTARPEACGSLLLCLDRLISIGPGARRTIPLQALDPDDEAKISGGQRFRSFERLRLEYCEERAGSAHFHAFADGNVAVVRFTRSGLRLFREGVVDVMRGTGDYCITPDPQDQEARKNRSLELWFWPCFGHHAPMS